MARLDHHPETFLEGMGLREGERCERCGGELPAGAAVAPGTHLEVPLTCTHARAGRSSCINAHGQALVGSAIRKRFTKFGFWTGAVVHYFESNQESSGADWRTGGVMGLYVVRYGDGTDEVEDIHHLHKYGVRRPTQEDLKELDKIDLEWDGPTEP